VSSASLVSVKSQVLEDQANEESRTVSSMLLAEQRVRKRTISRASAREFSTSGVSGSHPPLSGTVTSPKSNRPRSTSAMSSTSGKGTVPMITLWQSYTQKSLEKVLQSRLVETLITVSVPSTVEQSASPTKPSRPASPSSRDRQSSPRASPAAKGKLHSPHNSTSRSTLGSREEQSAKRISRTGATTATDGPTGTSASPTRKGVRNPTKVNGSASKSASQGKADTETRIVPNFISGIHRPSTNPDFALDFNDFSKWTDPSATHMTVRLWARLPPDSPNVLGNEKGKDKMSGDTSDPQWRMAGKWDICLADLVPVPDEVSALALSSRVFLRKGGPQMSTQPSSLASNALLVTLFPPGKTFCLPVVRSLGPTRSPSPSSGYNSDPEIHTSGNPLASRTAAPRRKDFSLPKARQSRAEYAASSTWQNLVK
jgi:UV radiation resistance-associated gene protein